MNQWKEVFYTVCRVFVGTLLAALVAALGNGLDLWNFEWDSYKPIIAAAVIAAATVVVNALNPKETRYGIGAEQQ